MGSFQSLTEIARSDKAKFEIDELACGPHPAFDHGLRPVPYLNSSGHLP